MIKFKSISLSLLALSIFVSNAQAITTDWMTGYDIQKLARKGEFRGKIVETIQCKDSYSKDLNIGKTLYKVRYSENTSNKPFLWAIGNTFGAIGVRAKSQGLELVSIDQFRRKSGLLIRCGVWHKKP